MVRMCFLQEPHRLLSQSVKFFLPQTNVLWYVSEFVAINVRFGKMLTISFRAQRLEHDFVSEERYDQAKSTRVIPRTDELRYAVKGENNGHVLQCCSSTAGPLTSSSLTARKEAGTLSRVLFSSPQEPVWDPGGNPRPGGKGWDAREIGARGDGRCPGDHHQAENISELTKHNSHCSTYGSDQTLAASCSLIPYGSPCVFLHILVIALRLIFLFLSRKPEGLVLTPSHR
jgi:hypothetical protein